jgi:tRNA (guanine-N7-)-methyltransferase
METDSQNSQRRTIRSFVRRTGRLTPSQQRALIELWPSYGIDVGTEKLDFDTLFGRHAPIVLEIGFGNGESLLQQAKENPTWNFLGIEVHEPGVGHCLLQARDSRVMNLKLIKYDAIEILRDHVALESLQRVNIYFPDPWPKKRHHKRRMIQAKFLDLLGSRLEPGGTVHIATDWANYAEHIDAVIEQSVIFACNERREHDGNNPLDRPRTKFEQRGLRKGHRIWDWRIIKRPLDK